MSIKEGQFWRHKKTGKLYNIIGIGRMQSRDWHYIPPEDIDFGPSVDMEEVVIYIDTKDIWIRPTDEFLERFELIA